MKKIKKFILLFIMLIPMYAYAKSYDNYGNSVNNANKYMNIYPDKSKYLLSNGPYIYANGRNSVSSSLYRAGLLNKDEYLLSKGAKTSYLSSGQEYWTMTENVSNQHFYIDYDVLTKSNSANSGTRVTQFVKPTTVVEGNGTYNTPWTFADYYNVTFKVNSNTYGNVDPTSQMVKPNTIVEDIKITENTGYSYVYNDCGLVFSRKIDNHNKIYKSKPITRDTICVINFEKRKINITYSCDEGTGNIPSSTVEYAKSYKIEGLNCSRTGYSQESWKTKDGYEWKTGNYDSFTTENGEQGLNDDKLELHARYKANKYTVTYDCNDGTGSIPSATATYDSSFTITSSTCSKTGYTQDGWNTKKDGTGTDWNKTNKTNWKWDITNNVTLYAKWKVNTYVVKYYANGGSGAPNEKSVKYGEKFTVAGNVCEKTGYTQSGWNTKANGSGDAWTTTNKKDWTWNITNNVDLYAVWRAKTYTLTYNCNGGTNPPSSQTATYNVKFSIRTGTCTRTGYTQNGWNTKSDGTGTSWTTTNRKDWTWNIDDDVKIYAVWVPNTYSIEYNLVSGKYGSSHPTSATYDTAFTVNNPSKSITLTFSAEKGITASSTAEIKSSYVFNGWTITGMDSTTHHMGSSTNTSTSVSKMKVTAYKNLRATSGTVRFTADWSIADIKLPKITKTGHTCVWTSDNISVASEGNYSPNGETSKAFTATCTPNTYTVTYNCNGGSGAPASVSVKYGDKFSVSKECSTAKTGYKQNYWNEKSDGSGTNWNKDNATDWTWTYTKNVTLYAKWTAKKYTVSFDCNGGSKPPSNQTATYNSKFSLTSSTCTRSGYKQNGWKDQNNVTWTATNTKDWLWTYDYDVTLKAIWEAKEYTATETWKSQGNVAYNGTAFPFDVTLYYKFTKGSDGKVKGTVKVTGSVSGVPGPSNYLKGKFSVGSWSETFDKAVSTNSDWISLKDHDFGKVKSITIKWEPDNNTKIWDSYARVYIIKNSWNAAQSVTVKF